MSVVPSCSLASWPCVDASSSSAAKPAPSFITMPALFSIRIREPACAAAHAPPGALLARAWRLLGIARGGARLTGFQPDSCDSQWKIATPWHSILCAVHHADHFEHGGMRAPPGDIDAAESFTHDDDPAGAGCGIATTGGKAAAIDLHRNAPMERRLRVANACEHSTPGAVCRDGACLDTDR